LSSEAVIESLDQEGRGVAHVAGKVAFIEDALPGEAVLYSPYRRKNNYELGKAERILRSSSMRVAPRCRYFGICGGCSTQHLDIRAQVAAKQRILEDNLWHIGSVKAEMLLPPIYGQEWEYRQRARLSVRYVSKKGGVLIGFHERRSSFVADMQSCEILPRRISELISPLRELIGSLSLRESIPQLELAIGEAADVLVLRILDEMSNKDRELLKAFAERHKIQFYLQPGGPDSAYAFYPENSPGLYYTLPEFKLTFNFHPTEYTQVNHSMNRMLVRRAMQLLEPAPGEKIADLFCGLGNFTLPAARCGAAMTGIEGDPELKRRAEENAALNGLTELTDFRVLNLFKVTEASLASYGSFDKMLLDPPRDGAVAVVKAVGKNAPRRIVYISCNPATLARDAAVLVHTKGYELKAAGVINMFPHTSHIESIALFEKTK